MGPALGLKRLYFKLETSNPTGSYKDRFVFCELALKKNAGYDVCLATSSGNTGSSLASYAARFGMRCHIFVLEHTPDEKMIQMTSHGAQVHRVRGFGKQRAIGEMVPKKLEALSQSIGATVVVSAYRYCPDGMDGVKTISYEIADQLGRAPDHVFVPVGGGGLYSAVTRGFLDLNDDDAGTKVHVVQPSTNDTVVTALVRGESKARRIDSGTSVSGLGVLDDIDGTKALDLARQSGGSGFLPSESVIYETQRELMEKEGVYAEPAGAVSVAGLKRAVASGHIDPTETVVCIITGHGFKDTRSLPSPGQQGRLIDPDDIRNVFYKS